MEHNNIKKLQCVKKSTLTFLFASTKVHKLVLFIMY